MLPPARTVLALGVSLALCATSAFAQVPKKAIQAFNDGKFVLAATVAEADGTADALAFAARARIAEAMVRDGELCRECLLQAEAAANEAIRHDPNFAEGYVQLAIALGFRGRLMSVFDAQSHRLAEKGRIALDKALALDPSNNWARAALGAWHLEIVRRAGSVAGSVLYGASEDDGLAHFRTALAVEPGNLLLHYHFALSLLALDAEDFHAEALAALDEGILNDRAKDALTRNTLRRAQELRTTLRKSGGENVALLVRRLQGYPPDVEPAMAKH